MRDCYMNKSVPRECKTSESSRTAKRKLTCIVDLVFDCPPFETNAKYPEGEISIKATPDHVAVQGSHRRAIQAASDFRLA